jgi:hypothetical protein
MTAVSFDNVWKRDATCHHCVVEEIKEPALQRDRHGVFSCFVTATLKFNDTVDNSVKQIITPLQCPGTPDLHCMVCDKAVGSNVYCYEVLYGICYGDSTYVASPVSCSNDQDPNTRNQSDNSGGLIFIIGVTLISWILLVYSILSTLPHSTGTNEYQMVQPV